jgi:hypothetical protein
MRGETMDRSGEVRQEVNRLRREIRAKEKEQVALEEDLRQKFEPEVRRLVRSARKLGYEWYDRVAMFPAHYRGGGEDQIVDWTLRNVVDLYVGDFEVQHVSPLHKQLSERRRELRELQRWRETEESLSTLPKRGRRE